MTCLRCQRPITGKGTTGLCQPCSVRPQGVRMTATYGPQAGRSGREKRIWIRKAKTLLKKMEGKP